jgi:hypothetical protein
MMTYQAAREALAEQLLCDARAHEQARFDEIGRRFDTLERAFPPGTDAELAKLRIALTFWDGWIDARNRGWPQSRAIQPGEWPVLARSVAADLAADRDITDPRVRSRFDARTSASGSDRVHAVAARLLERDGAH